MMIAPSCRLTVLLWVLVFSPLACEAGFSGGFAKKKPNTGKSLRKKKKKPTNRRQQPIPNLQTEAATLQHVDLGGGHSVDIYVPPNRLEDGVISSGQGVKIDNPAQFLKDFYGSGDVIWPSSLHLARLVANCPSFVAGKRVIDIGCGLGLAAAAALLGKPESVTVSDSDDGVMDLAMRTLENINNDDNIELKKCRIDWLNKETWPAATALGSCTHDVVLASDVLFNKDSIQPFAELVAHCLVVPASAGKQQELSSRALIVDPANRPHRDQFVKCCDKLGLTAVPVPFPGQEKEYVLINVLPSDSFGVEG